MGAKNNNMLEGKEEILVVDDDERIRRLLKRYLTRNNMSVHEAENGQQMRYLLDSHNIDLILLDLVMPEEDGFDLARDVRQKSEVPIIILSGRADTVDKIVGLEVGADDYVTKPFDERELLARVRSALRRGNMAATPGLTLNAESMGFDGRVLNVDVHELHFPDGKIQPLTKHEFLLFEAFIKRPNRIWTRNEILDLVAAEREWQ